MKLKSARAGKVRHTKGSLSARSLKIGVVVADFNEPLTRSLLDGALDTLLRLGASARAIRVVHVPGAFEIPVAAQKLIRVSRPDVVLTLAVVIKGKTRHFDQVVRESAQGIRELSLATGIPVILGILAAHNAAEAFERTGVKHMNKGREWALAAVEIANLIKKAL